MKKYYLHRISHEGNASYSLLKKGYLSLGWEKFADTEILDAAREDGYPRFDIMTEELGENHNRSRWSMWYFAQMNVGDVVIVPLYSGKFSAYEVCEKAKSINELENEISELEGNWDRHSIRWKNHRLYDLNDDYVVDLGFYIRVKPIIEESSRKFLTGKLSMRMKIRTTNADISELEEDAALSIECAKNNKPISIYESLKDETVEIIRKSIDLVVEPSKFEYLVKWYLEKCGATTVWIPAKNEPGKTDGADADIIADFENLKHRIYVQAKFHKGQTSNWAVTQIDRYRYQKSDIESAYSYAAWVISSADKFSEQAVLEAKENGIRLINGSEFARMLLDVGMLNIDDAFGDTEK